jgi:NAD(P)-dependent dehydrogenase (short-subunit alcohol dehydrogenase family)
VTGAASGIGAATARIMAREGARIGLIDLDAAKGEAVAKEIGANGALFLQADVTQPEALESVIGQVAAHFWKARHSRQ